MREGSLKNYRRVATGENVAVPQFGVGIGGRGPDWSEYTGAGIEATWAWREQYFLSYLSISSYVGNARSHEIPRGKGRRNLLAVKDGHPK